MMQCSDGLCSYWPPSSDGPMLLFPHLLSAAVPEAADVVHRVSLFCTKLRCPNRCHLSSLYKLLYASETQSTTFGHEPMASAGLSLSVHLNLLLLPARPIVSQSASQSYISGCLRTRVAVTQLIPSSPSSLPSGSERGRQYQQVLRRSHVAGAGQAGRGAQLPHVRPQHTAPVRSHRITRVFPSPSLSKVVLLFHVSIFFFFICTICHFVETFFSNEKKSSGMN